MDLNYIIVEIQTLNTEGSVAHITYQFATQSAAEQKYHNCLSAAAVSELPCHAVAMLDSQGRLIKREMYKTTVEPEQGEL